MNFTAKDLTLYLVTDRRWLDGKSLAEEVESAIKGGVTFVQLREKELEYEEFLFVAREIREVTRRYGVPFVINDNVEIAIASDADGVHVGQSDRSVKEIRALLGENKIIGLSASTVATAIEGEAIGADYIGVGAVFSTSTKLDASCVSREELIDICSSISIPVVAIGGISADNLGSLSGTGIAGVAVVSAILAQGDSQLASSRLRGLLRGVL